jgi:YVTN family beta-propeller protein
VAVAEERSRTRSLSFTQGVLPHQSQGEGFAVKRHIVSAWVAIATVFFVLVGAQSAHAAVVSTVDYVLHSPSDWVTSTAVTPDGRYVFVTNYFDGSVSRFDTSTHAITNVSVGSQPYGVAISPDGTTVAVACSGSNAIVYVDVNTMSNSSIGNGGSGPMGIAYNHAGTKLYVVDVSTDEFREINPTSHATLNTVQIPGGSQYSAYVVITSNDLKAYVTNIGGNSVSEINLTTHAVTRTFTGFPGARGLALNADESGLWVGGTSNTLSLINLSTGLVSQNVTIGNGALEMALSPDGSQLAVGQNLENFISLVDTQTFQVTQAAVGDPQASTVTTGKTGPWGVAYAPDGATLYVSVEYNGKLAALTLDPALTAPNNNGGSSNTSGSGGSSGSAGSSASALANTGAPALTGFWALGALLTIAGASFVYARRRRI